MKRVYTYIDDELHYRLRILVAKERTSISRIVREFLQQWAEQKDKPPPE